MKEDENKPKVLDLFSGCGGFSLGFIEAGYEVILGVDNDEIALETFDYNHDNADALKIDLSEKKAMDKLRKKVGSNKIDVIIGGPPCQGFSLTGKRNLDDDRNTLYKSMVKAVEIFNPQAFILENVKGLLTLYNGKAKKRIIEDFTDLGYNIEYEILNAANYGVPQNRKRVFFVGLKDQQNNFEFPKKTHKDSEYVTCGEAISDLPSLEDRKWSEEMEYIMEPQSEYQKFMRENSNKIYNNIGTRHTKKVVNVISQVPEGGNHKDLPPGVGESRNFNEAWTRYHRDKPSRTIDTGHRNHFHYEYNRVPTVRENARLQSFPDDFIFKGSKTKQYRHVGNAVPPLLAKALAEKLKNYIKIRDELYVG